MPATRRSLAVALALKQVSNQLFAVSLINCIFNAMSRNYKFHNADGLYFISFSTVFWVDVFVRKIYFDCIVDNLNHCLDYTSKQLIKLIEENTQESRREWLLNSFKKAAATNSNNTKNQFWQQDNHPIELWSTHVIKQKIDYTHNNPVEAGFVEFYYEYLYSSARDYRDIK